MSGSQRGVASWKTEGTELGCRMSGLLARGKKSTALKSSAHPFSIVVLSQIMWVDALSLCGGHGGQLVATLQASSSGQRDDHKRRRSRAHPSSSSRASLTQAVSEEPKMRELIIGRAAEFMVGDQRRSETMLCVLDRFSACRILEICWQAACSSLGKT